MTRSCLRLIRGINLWCFKVDLVLGVLMLLMEVRNLANSPVEGTVVFTHYLQGIFTYQVA